MSDMLVCDCGNNMWFATPKTIKCTKCGSTRGDLVINQPSDQTKIIEAMGIPPSLPNALELAQAQLDRLKHKERILKKIEELIGSD